MTLRSDLGASITQISTGFGHQLACAGDGTIRCWGWNEYGQLGHAGFAGFAGFGDDELPGSAGPVPFL